MLKRFKTKWDIRSNSQLVVILIVFSVTGSASLLVRKAVFEWVGITADTTLWIKAPLYLLVIVPAYQILFLLFGTLFGQFRFAWEFEKRFLSRLKIIK